MRVGDVLDELEDVAEDADVRVWSDGLSIRDVRGAISTHPRSLKSGPVPWPRPEPVPHPERIVQRSADFKWSIIETAPERPTYHLLDNVRSRIVWQPGLGKAEPLLIAMCGYQNPRISHLVPEPSPWKRECRSCRKAIVRDEESP